MFLMFEYLYISVVERVQTHQLELKSGHKDTKSSASIDGGSSIDGVERLWLLWFWGKVES